MIDDAMCVGDLIEALERYDRDRIVACGQYGIARVVSVEPGGAVFLSSLRGKEIDPFTGEIKPERPSGLFGMLGGGGHGPED